MTRREMLTVSRQGFGSLALMGLLGSSPFGKLLLSDKKQSEIIPKARNVIFLYMDGGPSQVDTFDPKPRLRKEHGQDPASKFKVDATQFDDNGTILGSPWDFKQYGQSGIWISDLFPYISSCADELTVINSMFAEFPEHTNANYFLHTGHGLQGRPSMGAWVTYGLGSENRDLPGYVVLDGGLIPPGGLDNFKSGFLPASFEASLFKGQETPLANINPLERSDLQVQKLQMMKRADEMLLGKIGLQDQVEAAVSNYELAFRMQAAVPEMADISSESEATKRLYGLDSPDQHTRGYAAQCIMARRLVERGVRFVELTCPSVEADRWDQHAKLTDGHTRNAHAVDQPIAGLLKDLRARGLLDETLVIFAGEFGRTPFAQGDDGRDHNPSAFSIWLAGAGLRKGLVYGKTDDYGYRIVDKPVSVHDLHATMLHLLGIDHQNLTYRHSGRDIRLTDVHGHVVHDILS